MVLLVIHTPKDMRTSTNGEGVEEKITVAGGWKGDHGGCDHSQYSAQGNGQCNGISRSSDPCEC